MFQGLNKLGEAAEAFKKKMLDEAKAVVVEGAKELFAKYPNLEAVRWNQYTPAFNDGDPCYHHMGEVSFQFDGGDFEDTYELEDGPTKDDCKALSSALHGIDDALEMAFGTNQEITINRDSSVNVTDYDCGY